MLSLDNLGFWTEKRETHWKGAAGDQLRSGKAVMELGPWEWREKGPIRTRLEVLVATWPQALRYTKVTLRFPIQRSGWVIWQWDS